ncbi:MAG: NFACT family protein, partial [Coprococcus sp.]
MAFDGIVISNVVSDLRKKLIDGRIYKIYQPENDELNIVIKNNKENYRLLLSADASLPLIYLMRISKENPMTAPNFCMLLRKHINNGRIVDICQPGFERIVEITIEHLNELGDICRKKLIIEIMGKHSNIIFTDDKGMIIDSIKHISHMVSSVREVLPGRNYIYPPAGDKISPLFVDRKYFDENIATKSSNVTKAIYTSIIGFSPLAANEVAYRAGIDGSAAMSSLDKEQCDKLYNCLSGMIDDIKNERYTPLIVFDGYSPLE